MAGAVMLVWMRRKREKRENNADSIGNVSIGGTSGDCNVESESKVFNGPPKVKEKREEDEEEEEDDEEGEEEAEEEEEEEEEVGKEEEDGDRCREDE